jgi:hypothetical protein
LAEVLPNVDYSSVGWDTAEPLIREATLSFRTRQYLVLGLEHGDTYIDTSDYNSAEEEIVTILHAEAPAVAPNSL